MRKFNDESKLENNPKIKEMQNDVKDIIKNFGNLVKQARNEQNLRIQDVSQRSGVSSGAISDLENGKEKIPNLYTLVALAKTLNISNHDFIRTIFGEIVQEDPSIKKPCDMLVDALRAYGAPNDLAANILVSIDLALGRNPTESLIKRNIFE